MDLDHLPEVDRRFGHFGGDHALASSAARRRLRPIDLIVRYGGERVLRIASTYRRKGGPRIEERLRAVVAEMSIELGGHGLNIT
jgi:two-component system cell cycle response regulator